MKTLLSNAWLQRDLGFLYWVADASRCKRLLGSVEVTFMGEALWTVMIYFISRSKWKLRRMQNASCAARKNGHLLHLRAASLADSSPASVPLAFRVEPKPKSGIRQQDLLKKVVEIKPKRPRSDSNQPTLASSNAPFTTRKPDHDPPKEKEQSLPGPKKVEEQPLSGSKKAEEHASLGSHEAEATPKAEISGGGLLGLAYASSDDDDDE